MRVAQRPLDAPGHLAPRHPLAAVDARLHPVELGQHVVGEVEPAVGEDVALDPAQDAERRERLVGRGDLLGLAADVVGREPADRADGRRVVADREVLVAAVARRAAHLLHARPAVRPGRVAVQVAADVAPARRARGGSPRNGSSRSSGGHHGSPSARYTASSSGASGSGSSAATYAGAPVARTSAVPKRSGSATTSSTGTPSTVSPTARRSSCSITATICGSAAKRASTGAGSAAAHTTASRSHESRHRRTSPADLAAERRRDPADELRARG